MRQGRHSDEITLASVVQINLYVFGMLLNDWIIRQLDSILIITVEGRSEEGNSYPICPRR